MTDLITLVKEKRAEFEAFTKSTCTDENLKIMLETVFTKWNLDMVMFTGYTPSFNDGEPCEHYSYNTFDDDLFDSGIYIDRDENYEDHDYLAHIEDENFKVNEEVNALKYDDPKYREFQNDIDFFDWIVEQINYTNYKVLAYRNKSGQIELKHEDYYDY